jgi:hypothetical protein
MDDLQTITELLPFLIPIAILQIGLMVWALIDVIKRPQVRGNKVVWILVIVLINIIGPIVYLLAGRKEGPEDDEETAKSEYRS